MIKIESFVFNFFQVNTFVLFDETKECVIIDPGCINPGEKKELIDFISNNDLIPVKLLNTHSHIDHILGDVFITESYGLKPEIHKGGLPFMERLKESANAFEIVIETVPEPGKYLYDGDIIKFGNSSLRVLETPGHADGSICFYSKEQNFVIVGDVIFNQSIGRTDLPTGDFDMLAKSIKEKLYTLPDDTVVYPGHGPETSIGFEKRNNPFVN